MSTKISDLLASMVEARAMELLQQILGASINRTVEEAARFSPAQSVADVAAIRNRAMLTDVPRVRRGRRTVEYTTVRTPAARINALGTDTTIRQTWDAMVSPAGEKLSVKNGRKNGALTMPEVLELTGLKPKTIESTIYQLKLGGYIVPRKIKQ